MYFKIGDTVTVRKDLGRLPYYYGESFSIKNTVTIEMIRTAGKSFKINDIFNNKYRLPGGIKYCWTEQMFQEYLDNTGINTTLLCTQTQYPFYKGEKYGVIDGMIELITEERFNSFNEIVTRFGNIFEDLSYSHILVALSGHYVVKLLALDDIELDGKLIKKGDNIRISGTNVQYRHRFNCCVIYPYISDVTSAYDSGKLVLSED